MLFNFHCPDCRTTNDLHEPECEFSEYSSIDIELGYHAIFSLLSTGVTPREKLLPDDPIQQIEAAGGEDGASVDRKFMTHALQHLSQLSRIEEVTTDDGSDAYRLLSPAEYREEVSEPQMEPMKTVYEKGSVPGCHDNAVFSMIAFYEMVGLSWEETRQRVIDWLTDSGTWERGGFEEASPEQLVDSKRHVYEDGYGWKEKAKAAKTVIDRAL